MNELYHPVHALNVEEQRQRQTAQHTPGQWQVDLRHYPNSFHVSANNVPICQLNHWGKRATDLTADLKPEGETEANARLIAAAPELLEVCKEALLALESMSHQCTLEEWQGDYPQQAEALNQTRAAIAKASGNGGGK